MVELVCNTLDSYRFEIEQSGFDARREDGDYLPLLRVDREAIVRSLLKPGEQRGEIFSHRKYIGVHLYRKRRVDVTWKWSDHGIGIPRRAVKIFEKFYRVGDPLVHNTKGSGLGLSLVRHIVQAHGGWFGRERSGRREQIHHHFAGESIAGPSRRSTPTRIKS